MLEISGMHLTKKLFMEIDLIQGTGKLLETVVLNHKNVFTDKVVFKRANI